MLPKILSDEIHPPTFYHSKMKLNVFLFFLSHIEDVQIKKRDGKFVPNKNVKLIQKFKQNVS